MYCTSLWIVCFFTSKYICSKYLQLTVNYFINNHINYPTYLLLHVALCLLFTLVQHTAFLLSHKSLPAFLSPCVGGWGGGGGGGGWRVEAVVVAVQVGNMNYLAGRRCSAWKTAVSMARMDEERQEQQEQQELPVCLCSSPNILSEDFSSALPPV